MNVALRNQLLDRLGGLKEDSFYLLIFRLGRNTNEFPRSTAVLGNVMRLIEIHEEGHISLVQLEEAFHTVTGLQLFTVPPAGGAGQGHAPEHPKGSDLPLSRPALRRTLEHVLSSPERFDAFIAGAFPKLQTQGRLTEDQDRTAQFNMLLLEFDGNDSESQSESGPEEPVPEPVLAALCKYDPSAQPYYEQARRADAINLDDDSELKQFIDQFIRALDAPLLLARVFDFDSDVDAFCIDYFPSLSRRVCATKSRSAKFWLLDRNGGEQLRHALYRARRDRLRRLQNAQSQQVPTRATLRTALRLSIPDGGNLLDFVKTRFPELHVRLRPSFDRVRIENALLEGAAPEILLARLEARDTARAPQIRRLIEYETPPPSLEELESRQRALGPFFLRESDLDAFCMDHFPLCYQMFASRTCGLDRNKKLNYLLYTEQQSSIWRNLRTCLHGSRLLDAGTAAEATEEKWSMRRRRVRGFLSQVLPHADGLYQFARMMVPQAMRYLTPVMKPEDMQNLIVACTDPPDIEQLLQRTYPMEYAAYLISRNEEARALP